MELIVELLAILLVAFLFLGVLSYLIFSNYQRKFDKHMSNYLKEHRNSRNAYYEGRDSFIKREFKGCLDTVVILFVLGLIALAFLKIGNC